MCIKSFSNFLKNKKINIKNFAKILGVKKEHLEQYISGEVYPPKIVMEKIIILSEGEVQPMDFLFQYNGQFNIIEYIKNNLNNAIINRKEISFILKTTPSGLSRRLNGQIKFQKDELIKIMTYIQHKLLDTNINNY